MFANYEKVCYGRVMNSKMNVLHQRQAWVTEKQLEEIFKLTPYTTGGTMWRHFRKLVAVYVCTATEFEEEECAGFIAGTNGECCFKITTNGMRTCEWRESE